MKKLLHSGIPLAVLAFCSPMLIAPSALALASEVPVLSKPSRSPYLIKISGFRKLGKSRTEEFTVKKYSDGKALERTEILKNGVKVIKILDFNKEKSFLVYPATRQYLVSKLRSGPQIIPNMLRAKREKRDQVMFGVKCSTWIKRTACPYTKYAIADDLGVVFSQVTHHSLGQSGFEVVDYKVKVPEASLFVVPKGYVELKELAPGQNVPPEISL